MKSLRLLIISGISGSGKSTALRALEDLGYFCVDNLPIPLVERFADLLSHSNRLQGALVLDAREGDYLQGFPLMVKTLRGQGYELEILFLETPDEVLLRRFSETRRRHPLHGTDLRASLLYERQILSAVKEESTSLIDTGSLNAHQLKGIVQERYGAAGTLILTLLSFGFKHGLPTEVDMVLDVRFLPNPYFVKELSPLTGLSPLVKSYVLQNSVAKEFLEKSVSLLDFYLPCAQQEGKAYLTVGIGCTGGQHRSVAIVEELAKRLNPNYNIKVRHRDIEKNNPMTHL